MIEKKSKSRLYALCSGLCLREAGVPVAKRDVIVFCVTGFLFVNVLGSLSHFFYEWSGESAAAGIFFPVNESVWEHLKLVFFPAMLFFLCGLPFAGKFDNYALGTFLGILLPVLIIHALFYLYTAYTGESVLAADVSVFTVAVACGFVCTGFAFLAPRSALFCALSVLGILLLLCAYLTFTVTPPSLAPFCDPTDGTYGFGNGIFL